jgi:hypothetical protein
MPIDAARLQQVKERLESAGQTGHAALAALGYWMKLVTQFAPDSDLLAAVKGACESLQTLARGGTGPLFPDLTVRLIRVDSCLAQRAALARVLLRLEDEPSLLTHKPAPSTDASVFGSAWFLQSDLAFTREAYLTPLLLCLTPWIWGIEAARIPGVIIYDLGRVVIGRAGEATELMQLFLPPGSAESPERPSIGLVETSATISWWVEHLNLLFTQLTDLRNFATPSREYQPRRQFEVLLSAEQFGRRLQTILAGDRDLSTRRLQAFSALDTLEGLGVVSFDQACRLERAERALDSVARSLPMEVAAMLLPTARRAVDGLRECQHGFFLSSRVTSGGLRVPDRTGSQVVVPLEVAIGQYLRVLRNANHGFKGRNDAGRMRDEILLMAHDGNVPADVAFLPYLYWLEVMCDPERLRGRFRRSAPGGVS